MATDNSQRTLLHWAVLGSGEIDETSMAQLRNLISQVKMESSVACYVQIYSQPQNKIHIDLKFW